MTTRPQLKRSDLQRINVVGVSGSGKSTFARSLAAALDSPHIEMDRLYWKPNWTESDEPDFRDRLESVLRPDTWVLDGNYHGKTYDLKWSRATLVVWLDHSLPRTLYRAVGRALHRAWTQVELWPGTGNRESFRRSFLSHDSVLLWTMTSFGRIRKRYAKCAEESELPFVRLRTPRDVTDFFDEVKTLKAESL